MLACYARNEFPNAMIKIPAFVIGGLLILTGIAGYVLQDPGLSLKITGPLAEDTKLVLSDGKQKHELDLGFASSDAAGEHAYWLIYNLNLYHAKDSSQGNYAVDQTGADYEKKSFWYASSKGETMDALSRESDNYQGAGNDDTIEVDWSKVDINSSTIRFIFKNQIDSPGPITLQSNNWKNIEVSPSPKANEKIEFKKSLTAFIPGILGLILILLTLGAAKFPNAHKHFMHAAVLIGLIGFFAVATKVGSAVSEMNLLKSEPFMIIHVSSLKPVTMLLSAGLLLIFVILCIVSFIEARKNREAEESKMSKSPPVKKQEPKQKDSKDFNDKATKGNDKDDLVKVSPKENKSPTDKVFKQADDLKEKQSSQNKAPVEQNKSAEKESVSKSTVSKPEDSTTGKQEKASNNNSKSTQQSPFKEKESVTPNSSADFQKKAPSKDISSSTESIPSKGEQKTSEENKMSD